MRNGTFTRHIYGLSSSSTDDLAHIDIGANCLLVGVDWNIDTAGASDNDRVLAELSVASVAQYATNDAQGILAHASIQHQITTSGATDSTNKYCGPFAVPLPAGTRVYLHTTQTGSANTLIGVTLHCQPV